MSLAARVSKLERVEPHGEALCRECGGAPEQSSYRLEFDEPGERLDGHDRCPACGRQLVFRLEFDRQG